jgi:hypothetical protein
MHTIGSLGKTEKIRPSNNAHRSVLRAFFRKLWGIGLHRKNERDFRILYFYVGEDETGLPELSQSLIKDLEKRVCIFHEWKIV